MRTNTLAIGFIFFRKNLNVSPIICPSSRCFLKVIISEVFIALIWVFGVGFLSLLVLAYAFDVDRSHSRKV